MKQNKSLKLALMILIVVLISLISFGGIYIEKKGIVENYIKDFILARDLKGYRRVEITVSDSNNEETKSEEVKNETTTTEETATTETEQKNVITKDEYKKAKEIIEKRLSNMGAKDYEIRGNSETGSIILELEENEDTDLIVGNAFQQGKFEIVDNDTNEVLMTNDDIKSVKRGVGSINTGATVIYVNIEFNKEGTEKFKNITSTYQEVEEKVTDDNGTEKTETKTKEIALKIDGQSLLTTHFSEQINNGIMQLTIGKSTDANADELQDQYTEASKLAAILDSGNLPVNYNVSQNKYVTSDITQNTINKFILGIEISVAIGLAYLIIKYNQKGILGSISIIGYIALLLLVIRGANVEISIAGLFAIALSIIINYIMVYYMLNKEDSLEAIRKFTIVLIPALIIAIVFTLTNLTVGAPLFWGIALSLLYNLVFTKLMLK